MKAKRRESTIDNTGNDSVFTGGDGVLSHTPVIAFFFSGGNGRVFPARKPTVKETDFAGEETPAGKGDKAAVRGNQGNLARYREDG